MEENKIISDENLTKFFPKEKLEDMASLFFNGSFQELLDKHFYNNNQNNNIDNNINIEENKNNNNKRVFKYELIEILLDDELSQQIVLTFVLFCLLKNNNEIPEEIQSLFDKYNYPIDDMIFPLNLLKIKFYIKSKNIHQAIDNINKLIFKYEDYNKNIEEKKLDYKNLITIETFNQKFIYFDNLFNFLFNMNNLEAKIKKLYFELKSCFYQIKSFPKAFNTILILYQKYPEDILIQFELAKDSVINSKRDVFINILEKMKKNKEEEKDEYIKGIYANYIFYAEALNNIALNQFSKAQKKFEEIKELRGIKDDEILNNNIDLMNIYKWCLKEGSLVNKNDNINDKSKNILDKFNIK